MTVELVEVGDGDETDDSPFTVGAGSRSFRDGSRERRGRGDRREGSTRMSQQRKHSRRQATSFPWHWLDGLSEVSNQLSLATERVQKRLVLVTQLQLCCVARRRCYQRWYMHGPSTRLRTTAAYKSRTRNRRQLTFKTSPNPTTTSTVQQLVQRTTNTSCHDKHDRQRHLHFMEEDATEPQRLTRFLMRELSTTTRLLPGDAFPRLRGSSAA